MINAVDCVDMLQKIIIEQESKTVARISMVLWTIWWQRNQKCWNNQLPTMSTVIRRARDALEDWNFTNNKQPSMRRDDADTSELVWQKPANGSLKCNIDSACYVDYNYYCVGACIRDIDGKFVKAFMKKSYGSPTISEADAKGMLDVLE
jgi:hypothetical protein